MKNRIFTLLTLFAIIVSFVTMAHSSSERTIGQSSKRLGCLDRYLNLTSFAWDMMSVGLSACAQGFQSNPDGWIECNQVVTDSYFAMHAAADAAYDRCIN